MQLQALVDDLALQVGQPVFRHRGGGGIKTAIDVALDAIVDEHLGDGCLGLAFSQYKLGILEVDNGFAECLALLDIVEGQSERTFNPGNTVGGDLYRYSI